jgi:hypothetical protein
MARFVPPLDPATLTNNGERAVATALATQLPNSVTVYHGYLLLERFRSRTGREFFREGEIDFVIFDRRRGILVLEVKGGTISYDPEQGYRREETGEYIGNPFLQARDNMHALMDRVREQPEFAGDRLPFVRGYAVVLPHCSWSGRLPADVQPEMLLCYDDMPQLRERIEALLDLWSRRDRIDPLDDASVRGIRAGSRSSPAGRRLGCSRPSAGSARGTSRCVQPGRPAVALSPLSRQPRRLTFADRGEPGTFPGAWRYRAARYTAGQSPRKSARR